MTLINKIKFPSDNDFLVRMPHIYWFILTLRITCSILQTGLQWWAKV